MKLCTISRAGSRTDSFHFETSDTSKPYTAGALGPGPDDKKEKMHEVSLQDSISSSHSTVRLSRGHTLPKE